MRRVILSEAELRIIVSILTDYTDKLNSECTNSVYSAIKKLSNSEEIKTLSYYEHSDYSELGINDIDKLRLASSILEFNGNEYIYIKSRYNIDTREIEKFLVRTPIEIKELPSEWFNDKEIIIDTSMKATN